MAANIGITTVGQIAIAVDDVGRSVEFYRDELGLQLLFEAPPGLAFFDCNGVRLMLTTQNGEAADHTTSVIYYKVDDIGACMQSLADKGVAIVRDAQMTAKMQDHELWIGFIRDPDQNLIGVMAEVPL